MIRGFYSAVSAMLANLSRQEALAHNISNIDTPGFRQTLLSLEDFKYITAQDVDANGDIRTLGRLGLGVEASDEMIDFTLGALSMTGQPLDAAIEGEGFFTIRTDNGLRYSRDGRFARDAEGQLVTVEGHYIADVNGNAITLPDGEVEIETDGTILVDGTEIAQLGLAVFEDPEAELVRDLPNLFAAEGTPLAGETVVVRQGCLESANADPVQLMTQMVQVSRAYEAAQRMVQIQDELLGQTIASLGRL
ncbi:MAG: flagellar hook-basal body protein [Anaerolineales bacterium]|nr:flagellar hook-basal body protein [Anaerolineales bacterium]